jgi:hypothetical protein
MAIDHDGKGKCSTGYDHGDALHVGDFIPSRPGVEAFMPNEDGLHPTYHIRDPGTCAIITEGPTVSGQDTGRAVAADISPANPGAEMWAAGGRRTRYGDGKESERTVVISIWWTQTSRAKCEQYQVQAAHCKVAQCSSATARSRPHADGRPLGDWRDHLEETDSSALPPVRPSRRVEFSR